MANMGDNSYTNNQIEGQRSNQGISFSNIIQGTSDPEALCPYNVYQKRSSKPRNMQKKEKKNVQTTAEEERQPRGDVCFSDLVRGAVDPEALCPYNVYKNRSNQREQNTQRKPRSNNKQSTPNNQDEDPITFANIRRGTLDAEALCPYNVYN